MAQSTRKSTRKRKPADLDASNEEHGIAEPPAKKPRVADSIEHDEKALEETSVTENDDKENENKLSAQYLKTLKVAALKDLCREKGLKVGGNKTTLIARLLDPNSASAAKKGGKGSSRRSAKMVHDMLRKAGVEKPESVSDCLKKGIQRGHYTICESEGGLDQVIHRGTCICCSRKYNVSIRDVLYQSDYGGDYEDGGEGGAIQCEDCCGLYVTRLCEGRPQFDSGKFHNHCTECPGFGQCIGDYREAHCGRCGKHYFQGLSGFDCQHCERRRGGGFGGYDDDDDDDDDED
eukprot:CAMPEP_0197029236 /NCGR_PEP_ID=MMETSP1384-20130603/8739_1 /TAXON_ID=29189 /ORGANISM="Ammonia sp." /LENGTH=290 /DNA_ID=CAMNT_0042458367 /DNA_START=30 /DNA_END=899 /DNA_ORIENTATION=-